MVKIHHVLHHLHVEMSFLLRNAFQRIFLLLKSMIWNKKKSFREENAVLRMKRQNKIKNPKTLAAAVEKII